MDQVYLFLVIGLYFLFAVFRCSEVGSWDLWAMGQGLGFRFLYRQSIDLGLDVWTRGLCILLWRHYHHTWDQEYQPGSI